MSLATIALIEQILALAVRYGPDLERLVALAIEMMKQDGEPTPEQVAAVRAELDKAHAALQAATPAVS